MKNSAFAWPFLAAGALLVACSGGDRGITSPSPVIPADTAAPAVAREMRGLWIATVANIDWPSQKTLSADQQRAELSDILNRARAAGINTVIFQVRPAADAVYQSSLEPWASLLTGKQGTGPGYDPLEFAIQEAHARGMELHAWVNPFRAGNTSDTANLAAGHIFRIRRDLVRVYGSNIWMDPGEPDVQNHSMRVIADIVTRYDIDAIHADDYFYPYVVSDSNGKAIPFPDDATYGKYGAGVARDDWRRASIDRFVERMYREVHMIKPRLKVGISPFGIWRPGFPAGVQGLDAYASIYADSRKWLQQGWVDYLAPQLYWAIAAPQQSFPALYDWWLQQNTRGRHVWPGLAAYRVNNGTSSAFSSQEIPSQIGIVRSRNGGGSILYNASWTLKQNSGSLATALGADLYKSRALSPAYSWLNSAPPGALSLVVSGSTLDITPGPGESVRWLAMRVHEAGTWRLEVLFGSRAKFSLSAATDRVLVQPVSETGILGTQVEWKR